MPSLAVFLFLQRQLWEVLQPTHDHHSHNQYTLIVDTPQEAPQPDAVTNGHMGVVKMNAITRSYN